jgi:hypothetical protein
MSNKKPDWAFKVKNFGNDSLCRDVQELKKVLEQKHRGESVSIVFQKPPNGLLTTLFVDVSTEGEITNSYGNNETINLDDLLG